MIACLTVSYFAAAVERRHQEALSHSSLVIGGQPWESSPLFGFSREAARRGVRPGMPLRQAHMLAPESNFLPSAPPRYVDAAGEVVDVLTDFTLLIAPEALWQPEENRRQLPADARTLPARYTIDLESLPSREAMPLVQEMGRTVRRHTHLEPAAGLAADPFTAHVAATLASPNHLRPVEAGEERAFLAERSLAFLPLEKEWARRLRLLGIRTLGQLAALSPAALREQFGADIMPLYRLARGEGAAPLRTLRTSTQQQVFDTRRFEPPLVNWLGVQQVLEQMADDLAHNLAEATMTGRTLCLLVETDRDAPQHVSLPLRQATADAQRLAQAAQELAQALAIDSEITALTLSLGDLQPAVVRQLSLFEKPTPPPAETLSQVMARHPTARFLRPVRLDGAHPLAECRFALRSLA